MIRAITLSSCVLAAADCTLISCNDVLLIGQSKPSATERRCPGTYPGRQTLTASDVGHVCLSGDSRG